MGLGYVGLTTALGLAKLGHEVIGVETNEARLLTLKQGTLPIFEPGLDLELEDSLRTGRLTLTGDLGDTTEKADFFFICVSTPQSETGKADLTFVQAVYKDLVQAIKPESIIVLKSTVPVAVLELIVAVNVFEVPVNKMKVQLSTEVYAFVYLLINVIHRSLRIKRFCWDQKFKTQSLNIKNS
jgi:UDPglucose 6-dehydrogenase